MVIRVERGNRIIGFGRFELIGAPKRHPRSLVKYLVASTSMVVAPSPPESSQS